MGDWKQWAKERPLWIGGLVEDTFWTFIDQKWRDALNVAGAEPAGWDQGSSSGREPGAARKEDPGRSDVTKHPAAGFYVAVAAEGHVPPGQFPKKCKFADAMGCAGMHPPWWCGAFRDKAPEEKAKIIEDNKLCPFCLLHDMSEVCYSKVYKTKRECKEAECKGQHIQWLHEVLKGIS
jgi:hypothetical protein